MPGLSSAQTAYVRICDSYRRDCIRFLTPRILRASAGVEISCPVILPISTAHFTKVSLVAIQELIHWRFAVPQPVKFDVEYNAPQTFMAYSLKGVLSMRISADVLSV